MTIKPFIYNFRQFSGLSTVEKILNKKSPEFKLVPFLKENIEDVIKEVPEFKYYYIGNIDAQDNPFKGVPQSKPIFDTTKLPQYNLPENEIKFSKLENGLRIASLDKSGLISTMGLYVHAGSRFEDPEQGELGVSSMIENMSFHSTAHLSHLRTLKVIETIGANVNCTSFREHIVYSAECLRNYYPILLNILVGNVLFPRFLPWEVKSCKDVLVKSRKSLESNPDNLITELLHQTAWHNNTLGLPGYCPEGSESLFSGDLMRQFMLKHFSPDRMIFVGINVCHDDLCKWLMRAFAEYNAIPPSKRDEPKPIYTGGDKRIPAASPMTHLAIAFETPSGWRSPNVVALTILQTLMGGGGSFSTGGPGKGMYSRLFLNVLNKHEWVDSCMAFNTQHSDTGLFGIYMIGNPNNSKEMVNVIAKELKSMANITKDELDRAKNLLKSFLWMSLEYRQVHMEDIARQLMICNRVCSGYELCQAIDAVTPNCINSIVNQILKSPPTVVAYGDIARLPHYNEIKKLF